jgi:hypothetical protein
MVLAPRIVGIATVAGLLFCVMRGAALRADEKTVASSEALYAMQYNEESEIVAAFGLATDSRHDKSRAAMCARDPIRWDRNGFIAARLEWNL